MTIFVGSVEIISRRNSTLKLLGVSAALETTFGESASIVCDTMSQAELDSVIRHLHASNTEFDLIVLERVPLAVEPRSAELPKPAFEEQMVPATDDKGNPTLAWYTKLLNHVFQRTRPSTCLLLTGPPGVGKSLAIERIGEMLRRQRTANGEIRDRRVLMGVDRRNKVARLVSFSCASIEDSDDAAAFVESVAAYAAVARADDILVLDDVDALEEDGATREKLLKIVGAQARCRRIIILNDLYDSTMQTLRRKRTHKNDTELSAENFTELAVGRAHVDSLAAYLKRKIPSMNYETTNNSVHPADVIACHSNGDVRAALIAAMIDDRTFEQLQAAMAAKKSDEQPKRQFVNPRLKNDKPTVTKGLSITADVRQHERPNITLLRCARAPDPMTECRTALADTDLDSTSQLMYANAPRYLTAQLPPEVRNSMTDKEALRAEFETLNTAADILLSMGDADIYDTENRTLGFAGSDATETDSSVLFEFSVTLPATMLGRHLRKRTREYTLTSFPDFPLSKLIRTQAREAALAINMAARTELVSRVGAENTAQQLGADDAEPDFVVYGVHLRGPIMQVYDLMPLLLNNICRRDWLKTAIETALIDEGLWSKHDSPTEEEKRKDWPTIKKHRIDQLRGALTRCAHRCLDSADFARLCTLHFAFTETRHNFSEPLLTKLFDRLTPLEARDTSVLGTTNEPTRKRTQAGTTEPPPAKKPTVQKTISSMFSRLSGKK